MLIARFCNKHDLTKDLQMKLIPNKTPAKGWKGGFLKKHPETNYPDVNLCNLDMTDNLDNIGKITRQQRVLWPEFTWETHPGETELMSMNIL